MWLLLYSVTQLTSSMISRRKFTTIPSFNYWRYSQTQFDRWQIEHKNENSSWSIHEQDRNKLAHRNEEGQKILCAFPIHGIRILSMMAAIVDIVSRRGLRIGARRTNQPDKSKLALYKPLLCLYSHLKQPYISNKTKRFSCKGGRGVRGRARIEAFQRRAA